MTEPYDPLAKWSLRFTIGALVLFAAVFLYFFNRYHEEYIRSDERARWMAVGKIAVQEQARADERAAMARYRCAQIGKDREWMLIQSDTREIFLRCKETRGL